MPLQSIPRRPFALAVIPAGVASVVLGVLVAAMGGSGEGGTVGAASAASMGGSTMTLASIGLVLGLGAVLALVPLMGPPLVTAERWGMVVLCISGLRTMLAMFAMMVLIQILQLERKPVVFGLLTGTLVMMIVEAAAAVVLLSRRERLRAPGSLQRSAA